MGLSRVFKRCQDDPKGWWHWRDDCNLWLAIPMWKRRGKVIVYLTLIGLRPTTYRLCPGCLALDARIRTKDFPFWGPPVTTVRQFPVSTYNPWGIGGV